MTQTEPRINADQDRFDLCRSAFIRAEIRVFRVPWLYFPSFAASAAYSLAAGVVKYFAAAWLIRSSVMPKFTS